MKRFLFIAFLALTCLSAGREYSQNIDTNAKIKTMFIYNFTKYIDWPSSYKQGNFVIGLLGESSLYSELKKMAGTKKAVTQQFEIRKYSTAADIKKCHILIIPAQKAEQLKTALSKIKGYSTLVITNSEGLAKQGAGINFVVINNKQRFEINRTNVEKQKLKISNNLISLAIEVS